MNDFVITDITGAAADTVIRRILEGKA